MHVGIRGPLYSRLDLDESAEMGFAVVHCRDLLRHSIDDIINRVRERLGQRPVYVSLDIDVLDPAFAPGTGTPEAGGMSSAQLLEILRGLDGLNVVGADIVEVAPAYDRAELTGIAAAHAAYELQHRGQHLPLTELRIAQGPHDRHARRGAHQVQPQPPEEA
jgi:agmatinase